MKRHKRIVLLASVSVAASYPSAVLAQRSEATGTPAAEAQEGGLAHIVVTAQRRSESLQRVPVAVTALSSTALQNAGIQNTAALEQATPSLTIARQIGAASPYIRGVGTANASTPGLEAPVAIYVAIACAISGLSGLLARETRGVELAELRCGVKASAAAERRCRR